MSAKSQIRPQHKVCERNVEVPTILVEPFIAGGKPEVLVQWFGEAEGNDLAGMQFRFPVLLDPDDCHWMSHPELFSVIFFGQAKDWPTEKTSQDVIDLVVKGDSNAWIFWIASSHYGIQQGNGSVPACFVLPMPVMLGDGVVGVIRPKKFCDVAVLDRVKKEFHQKHAK